VGVSLGEREGGGQGGGAEKSPMPLILFIKNIGRDLIKKNFRICLNF